VPEVRRGVRRDGWPEAHQHILRAAVAARHTLGAHAKQAGIASASG
jgi:hypothetical protein